MQTPINSGSSFFNYKEFFSIVLLVICDAKYRFIIVDIGDSGRQSNGSVYNFSHLDYANENNTVKIPGGEILKPFLDCNPLLEIAQIII